MQGETLSADTSALADANGLGTFTYHWQADGVDIQNANSTTLLLGEAQVGKAISVLVNYTDGGGTFESVASNPTDPVAIESDQINGTAGSDTLIGTAGDDVIAGLGGDDIIFPGLGNDSVDGGAGSDTLRLELFPNEFHVTQTGDHQYTAAYLDFTTVIDNVESVEFGTAGAEYTTRLSIADLVDGHVQDNLAYLTDLYLAFFGRAPDVSGLEYWQYQLLEAGRDFATISKDFSWSTEAQALFPAEGSNRDFVQTVYQNCFGRDPDAGGWDYWTDKLDLLDPQDPDYLNDRGAFVGELLLGAYAPTSGEEDRSLLTNRHEVALDYVNKLAVQPEEGFDAAINDLLAMVTMDPATQGKAEHVIDHVFSDPIELSGVMNNAELLAQLWAEG
jgi:hypothetical protein